MNVHGVTEMDLKAKGELTDVFDGRPARRWRRDRATLYMRQVYVPLPVNSQSGDHGMCQEVEEQWLCMSGIP
jgi:hypothetical protein